MKKLLVVLFLTCASTSLFANIDVKSTSHATPMSAGNSNGLNISEDIDVRPTSPGTPIYAGDSYGFYIDEVPDAVSYTWSLTGITNSTIYPSGFSDRYIDVLFGLAGTTDVTCTVLLSDSTEVVYSHYAESVNPN